LTFPRTLYANRYVLKYGGSINLSTLYLFP
jgi:hypothetical protein